MELKEKLTVLRRRKGLSQLELSELIGVSRQAVSKWEVGDAIPSTENLKGLSRVYGIPLDRLLDNTAEVAPEEKEILFVDEQPKERKTTNGLSRNKTAVVIIIALLSLFLTMLVYFAVARKSDENVSFMNEMAGEKIETSSAETFSFGW